MGRLVAARQRLPAEAAFSGMAAAWLHGVDVSPCDPIEVIVPSSVRVVARSGIRIREAVLEDADVLQARGLRATAIPRTIADLCCRLSLVEATVIADESLRKRLTSIEQLSRWADAHPGRAGIRTLRSVIGHAEPKAQSQMETRLRMLLVLGGLPRPKAQVRIYDANGRFVGRPDLYYEDARLGIEYDGAGHRSSVSEDNQRQNNLFRVGVRLLRFTAPDVLGNREFVLSHVRAALDSPRFPGTAAFVTR